MTFSTFSTLSNSVSDCFKEKNDGRPDTNSKPIQTSQIYHISVEIPQKLEERNDA